MGFNLGCSTGLLVGIVGFMNWHDGLRHMCVERKLGECREADLFIYVF